MPKTTEELLKTAKKLDKERFQKLLYKSRRIIAQMLPFIDPKKVPPELGRAIQRQMHALKMSNMEAAQKKARKRGEPKG
jgi:hypothetical protein